MIDTGTRVSWSRSSPQGRVLVRPKVRTIPLHTVVRTCGDCTLCCKVMGIEDPALSKPKDAWCQHARAKRGCGIYETRPETCRSFQCEWLAGNVQGEFSPASIKGLITKTTDGKNWVLHEDPGYEGKARTILKPAISEWLRKSPANYFIIVCGSKRSFLGMKEQFELLKSQSADEVSNMKNVHEVTT